MTLSGSGVVGPAVSTFYVRESELGSAAASIGDFYSAMTATLPDNVTWTIPHNGDTIEDSNGELVGTWSETGSNENVTGAVNTSFGQGVGIRVRWNTGGIFHGRRVVGTTFIVPCAVGGLTTDGLWSTATASLVDGAADALVTAENLVIWSRPSPGGSDGESNTVTGAFVPLQVSWLRSRRV